MKHWKRVATIVTLLLVLVASLTACANVSLPPEQQGTDKKVEEANKIKDLIPKTIKFAGQKMVIYTDQEEKLLYDSTELGSVKTSIQTRNDYLAANYQITLDVRAVSKEEIYGKLKETVETGLTSAHALCYSAETTSGLFSLGYLADIASLPDFSAEACGIEDFTTDSRTTGTRLYMLSTPALPYSSDLYCVFYRKDSVAKAGLNYPEQAVLRGEWTVETFRQYAEAIAYTVMNKSSYDAKLDTFGYSSREKSSLPVLLGKAAGIRVIGKDRNGYPSIEEDLSASESICTKLQVLLKSKSRAPYYGSEAVDAFFDGRIGLYIDKISFIDVLYENKMESETGFDYGILPLPCGKKGEYVTPTNSDTPVLSVPVNTPLKELSGLGISVLVGAGRITIRQAAIDSFIALFSFDNEQSCMIDMIIGNASADFGTLYESALQPVYNCASGLYNDRFSKGSSLDALLKSRKAEFDACIDSNFRQNS